MLYAAALGEQPGVAHAISLLAQEIYRDMALLGCGHFPELKSRIAAGP
jgi:L-lactate dehydrogenase (cytochrome)